MDPALLPVLLLLVAAPWWWRPFGVPAVAAAARAARRRRHARGLAHCRAGQHDEYHVAYEPTPERWRGCGNLVTGCRRCDYRLTLRGAEYPDHWKVK